VGQYTYQLLGDDEVMSSIHVWKTELYDNKLGYVSEFGKEVVELLNPTHGEKIFDLGCGTGDLANEISKKGATVTGMDISTEMVGKARKKYPDINFFIGNAEEFQFDESFDAVFSNAALHWMKNARQVVKCVWNVLNNGGRFVAEFGGHGNVETIIKATSEVLYEDYGIDAVKLNPWFFPSIAEYSTLLEQQGFHVTYAVHFDRPTKMEDGENGLNHWLTGLADDFFKEIAEEEKRFVFEKIATKSRKDLFQNGSWYVDYKRIRIRAIKP
jgi:trans-aconitate methyltransferase